MSLKVVLVVVVVVGTHSKKLENSSITKVAHLVPGTYQCTSYIM